VLLSILPFSFDVGLNQLLCAIVTGCSVVLMDSWLPVDILKATEQFKVTGISGVPAIWSDMLAARMSFDTHGRHASLRYITLSGGDLAADQLARLPALAPDAGIFKTYGQSEDFRSSSLRPEEFAQHARSVGRAFAGTRVYVVREDGSRCHSHEEGEIVHTGLGTMLGYLDGDDGDRKLRPNPFCSNDDAASIAVYTGDLGYLDDAGYLHVNGRRDAMLKIAGNRVYPREIVEQAMTIAGVREAEVVGAKTSDGQTHLVAFVVATSGPGTSSAPLLRRELAARLPSYMVPHEVVLVDAIPRTASGKPDRPALIDRATTILSTGKM
jgi:acyl-CoA synthetase (AMP-forming)/AMP-acid ligase II